MTIVGEDSTTGVDITVDTILVGITDVTVAIDIEVVMLFVDTDCKIAGVS